jgi:hypothetical protein
MSAELRITPVPHATGMTLLLQGATLPPAGRQVQRQLLQLDAGLMERFRRSELTPAELAQLSGTITDWLLDAEVRGILTAELAGNGGGLRVVFVVPETARPIVAQLPLELLWHDAPNSPLVLRKDVQSLVYLLSKTRSDQVPETSNWPFKVLIVRARPADLEDVPEVAGLANQIQKMGEHYGQRMVQIDVISSEPGIGVPATWNTLREHLRQTGDYNVLVYVGHGEVLPGTTGDEPMGQLFMESEDGAGHKPVSAAQLARLLRTYPIRMVVLAGCLTGADPVGTTRQRGGELGVAQALVNSSEAGVQVAVAMRTEIQTTTAITFVRSLFRSLLNIKPDPSGRRPAGDVDRAVRAAREELYLDNDFPPQWAAPIVLRATEREPFLEFLANPIQFHVSEMMEGLLLLRAQFWTALTDYSLAAGLPEPLLGRQAGLNDLTASIRAEGLKQGPLLLPRDLPLGPGQSGEAIVELAGALATTELRGRVTASNDGWVKKLTMPQHLPAQFQLLTDANDAGWFEFRAKGAGPTQLPAGEILRVQIDVPQGTSSGVYPLRIEILKMAPTGILWPGDGAVIVPRP